MAVIRGVAYDYDITVSDILSVKRFREVTRARHAAYYELMRRRRLSYSQIGRVFGHDHSTVIYGIRMHKDRIQRGDVFTNSKQYAGMTAGLVA